MMDIIDVLKEALDKSAKKAIADWLSPLPKGGPWHVISDYVFGVPGRNDTASFVLLRHHDKLETILSYIENQAPVDIKKSKYASEGLIRYLRSPFTFSFTFILDDGDNFLATYFSASNMTTALEEIRSLAGSVATNSGLKTPYFSEVEIRLRSFIDELKRNGNAKLARQVLVVAAYAAVALDYLDISAKPSHVSWISDRDAILRRHDGIVWDIASMLFYKLKAHRTPDDGGRVVLIDKPKLLHIAPEECGKNHLDPLIRMPDYLAGAASAMNLNTAEFSHPKFETIGSACFSESANGVLCALSWSGQGIRVRRLVRRQRRP